MILKVQTYLFFVLSKNNRSFYNRMKKFSHNVKKQVEQICSIPVVKGVKLDFFRDKS